MSTQNNEQWLDTELRRIINTSQPEFDAEAWKRRHNTAYEALISRSRHAQNTGGRNGRRVRWLASTLAAAAVIFISVAILSTRTPPQPGNGPETGTSAKATSPGEIVSMMSLQTAYRQGGEEALNQQLDKALETLGPRPDRPLTLRALYDLNG